MDHIVISYSYHHSCFFIILERKKPASLLARMRDFSQLRIVMTLKKFFLELNKSLFGDFLYKVIPHQPTPILEVGALF